MHRGSSWFLITQQWAAWQRKGRACLFQAGLCWLPVHPSNSALHLFNSGLAAHTMDSLTYYSTTHTCNADWSWTVHAGGLWTLSSAACHSPSNPTWWPFDISTDGVSFMCTHSDLPPRRSMLQGKFEFLRIYSKLTLLIHLILWIPFQKISADEKISLVCGNFVIQYAIYTSYPVRLDTEYTEFEV